MLEDGDVRATMQRQMKKGLGNETDLPAMMVSRAIMVRLKRETRNQFLKVQHGLVDQFLGNMYSYYLHKRLWGWLTLRQCGGGAGAADLRNIGVSQAWNTEAISDKARWSGNTNPVDIDQSMGWQWIGWDGCLHQSADKVLLPQIWGEDILLANTV